MLLLSGLGFDADPWVEPDLLRIDWVALAACRGLSSTERMLVTLGAALAGHPLQDEAGEVIPADLRQLQYLGDEYRQLVLEALGFIIG